MDSIFYNSQSHICRRNIQRSIGDHSVLFLKDNFELKRELAKMRESIERADFVHRQIAPQSGPGLNLVQLPDDSVAVEDSTGTLIYIRYQSGVTVKRFQQHVIVKDGEQEIWLKFPNSSWCKLD